MLRSKVLLIAWMAVVFLFSTATVVISSDEVQDEPNKQSHEEVVLESSIPYLINYQGYLKDKAGNPITGTLPMRFSIWSESSGGIIVWSEVQSSVSITKGYFNVLLGNITSIPSEAFDDPFLWLQIEIAGETLSPREQIASVGYAFRAAKADSVSGPAGGDLTGTYPNPTIAPGAVSATKLADNAVITPKIQNGAVTQGKIAVGVTLPPSGSAGGDLTGTYPNPAIDTGVVSTGKLADNAVTSAKIQDGQVQTADLANSAVTQGKIAAGVTLPPSGSAGGDLTGTYPSPTIATGAVATGKLADFVATGAKSAQVKLDNGTAIRLFAEESAEVYFSDYGEGLLSNGRAHIELDPKFRQTVTIDAGHPMKVFVQVEGDCNGVYVTNKTATGFDVVELQGGKSNIPFSYRVVCKRKYYEDERLATPEEDARYNRRMMETVWPEVIAKHQAEQERMKAMEEQQRIEREKIKATPVEQ